ncbi:MAG: CpaD family pilus assembly lipoprotein [Kiloniellaceae bacterium]
MGSLLAALGLTGCVLDSRTPPADETVPGHRIYHSLLRLQPPMIRPQVETVTMVHRVGFADGAAELSGDELSRLVAFLKETDAGTGARVEIDGPRVEGGDHDPLTAARIASIADGLSRLGLRAEVTERPVESLTKPKDATVVMVTRAMVIEPDCATPKTIYGPRPTHIWSCATAAALGRMVADPLDLKRGRALGPADGEASVLGVQRYRADKIKTPKSESTKAGQ